MARDLLPEDVLKSLDKGQLAPFYLFYGLGEFRLEKVLDRIRSVFIPESVRDFNLEILYGDEANPDDILNRARSLPFMAQNRLMIIRRTERFGSDALKRFLPYLEEPVASTCLIFVSSKADFNKKFYKRIRELGRTVNFGQLTDHRVVPWIRQTAKELGLDIDGQACAYLHQIVGNSLRDLYAELEKLYLRYGKGSVGVEQVRELAIHSRIYTIFELMNSISEKKTAKALGVLNRFLEEEDKRIAPLKIIGMLNRQIRLLWQAKSILAKGGQTNDVAKELGLPLFSARNFVEQSRYWSVAEFERGLNLLYEADGLLKSSFRPRPVLENLVLTLSA